MFIFILIIFKKINDRYNTIKIKCDESLFYDKNKLISDLK